MNDRRIWRHFDYILLAVTVILALFGLAMIYSATKDSPELGDYVWDQAAVAVVGLILLFGVAVFDYRLLANLQRPIYLVTVGGLFATSVIGHVRLGAQRWLSVGNILIQPSEFAKILVILVLAKFLADHERQIEKLRTVLLSFALVAVPVILIYDQPDLSTAISLLVAWGVMVVMAGMRPLHMALLAGALLILLPTIWFNLEGYQQKRVRLFFDPGSFDSSDDQYTRDNIDQALIALGSGGWLGQGYGSGIQTQGRFLKVRHTDRVFSVVGEEMGLVGAALLMTLIVIVILRALRAASWARDVYGRLIAVGVATVIAFQAMVNIGMNLGLLPVAGIPLPFISYGRSSLVTLLIGIGLVESVVMRYRKLEF
jgi:rod shape determining protein RodA